jgi:hypothetical protein
MKDKELNDILQRAEVPRREAGYWEQFPRRVTAQIARRGRMGVVEGNAGGPVRTPAGLGTAWAWPSVFRSPGAKPVFALGLAAACIALGLVLGFWGGHNSRGDDLQLAQVRKYYREIEALFPNQLQAIVFDQKGTHLVLAQAPNLPASPPLYVKVSGPEGSQRFITFSGQQIRFNGEVCDVLADHAGHVLLVGHQMVWSSAQAFAKAGGYRIEAQALQVTL